MRTFAPGTLALTALLSLLTALGPLSTDTYLPSLPAIARHFGTGSGQVQLTLSAYLIGFALGLPIYGPISDRKGRKRVMLVGLAFYGIGSICAAVAPSLEILILCRVLQGIGGAGPMILARTVVRDLYNGARAAQELARMGAIMGLVPAVAPILGAGLELTLGWRANFILTFVMAVILTGLVIARLPETLKAPSKIPFSLTTMLRDFAELMRDRRFAPFALLNGATTAGLFTFVSGSSFVYQHHFRLDEIAFALSFGTIVIGFITGAMIAQKLAMRVASRVLIRRGVMMQCMSGLIMLSLCLLIPGTSLAISIPMAFYGLGVGFTLPQSTANAMMPFSERAGSTSSLLGIVQTSMAASAGALVGAFIDHGPLVLAGGIAAAGLLAFSIHHWIRSKGILEEGLDG